MSFSATLTKGILTATYKIGVTENSSSGTYISVNFPPSPYAKKIIAATYLGKMGSGREMDPFRRRAEEMGIELIENAHLMNDDELLARLKKATE